MSAVASDSGLTLIIDTPAPGAENMRRDVELLRRVAAGESPGVLRIYGFSPPCLSLGRLQSEEDIDHEACARDGIDIVRRPTGGRAVLHDQEVTYAVACRAVDPCLGGTVLESCRRIHAVVAAALRRLGVVTVAREAARDERRAAADRAADADCFAHPASHELLDASGRKLVGSAQARLGPALLQHGSILLEPPRTIRYLRRGPSEAAASAGATGLRRLLGARIPVQDVIDALGAAFGFPPATGGAETAPPGREGMGSPRTGATIRS